MVLLLLACRPDVDPTEPEALCTEQDVCDGVDNDCDGLVDEGLSRAWYIDADGDGYGAPEPWVSACDGPAGHVDQAGDCDDGDPAAHPGALWYADLDQDGYGAGNPVERCDAPTGHVRWDGDCDDRNDSRFPSALERCDLEDDDCDGAVDEEALDPVTWYADADADGFGDAAVSVEQCQAPAGYVADDRDCDDAEPTVNPLAEEVVCDAVDQDCDGVLDFGLHVDNVHYSTVQDAVDAADEGDTVCVQEGIWAGDVGITSSVVIQGAGSDLTVLQGTGAGPVVDQAVASEELTLRDLTVTGGDADRGAGVSLWGTSASLQDVVVEGNTCTGSSGKCRGVGVYVNATITDLEGVVIRDNQAQNVHADTGQEVQGLGLFVTGGNVEATDLEVLDNRAHAPSHRARVVGGGVCLAYSSLTCTDCVIAGNEVEIGSGTTQIHGVGLNVSDSIAVLDGVRIEDNHLTHTGAWLPGPVSIEGLVYTSQGGDVTMDHVRIAGNTTAVASSVSGGILHAYDDVLVANNLIVAGNSVTHAAAHSESSTWANGAWGYLSGGATWTLTNASITNNHVEMETYVRGGAYLQSGNGTLVLLNTDISDNSWTSDAVEGEAVYCAASCPAEVLDVSYSNLQGLDADDVHGVDSVDFSSVVDVDPGYSDVSGSDPTTWDLSLDSTSALIDAGDPSVLDADGSTSDIGAYGGPAGASW